MARKTKQDAEITFHCLLDSATNLFTKQGVANTTLNGIATEAGMTRGAIYWHFDNKDAVILALWERDADSIHRAFIESLSQTTKDYSIDTFRNTIKEMIRTIANKPEAGQIFRIIFHNVEFTDDKTELQHFLTKKKEAIYQSMEQAFDNLQQRDALLVRLPSQLLAYSILSYLHGLIHNYLTPGQQQLDLQKQGDILIDLFLDTLLKP